MSLKGVQRQRQAGGVGTRKGRRDLFSVEELGKMGKYFKVNQLLGYPITHTRTYFFLKFPSGRNAAASFISAMPI